MTTVVMTGGTSGFGAIAARRMIEHPGTRVILGARGSGPDGSERLPLDLASLDSVRTFAAGVVGRLGDAEIDALVLNAGILSRNVDDKTADGYETTFAVNHLAHYLLLRTLLGHLADGAVVAITTSGTHDPAERASLPTPRHADSQLLAYPVRDEKPGTAGRRAYTASKLCNVLTVRGLAALPEARRRQLVPVAFCPGQTPGTGLLRSMPLSMPVAWRLLGGPLRVVAPNINRRETAGIALADIALGTINPPDGEYYAALRGGRIVWKQPSELARDSNVRDELWRSSAELVGLTAATGTPRVSSLPGGSTA